MKIQPMLLLATLVFIVAIPAAHAARRPLASTLSPQVVNETVINQLQIGIDPLNDQFGDNHLVFDGITTAVSKPSTSLLIAAAVGGLIFRRRRHL